MTAKKSSNSSKVIQQNAQKIQSNQFKWQRGDNLSCYFRNRNDLILQQLEISQNENLLMTTCQLC